MKETIDNKTIWNEAAKTALVFAAVTIVCNLLKRGLTALEPPTFLLMLGTGVLWAAEFVGCIYLMRLFMQKLVQDYDGVINSDTYKYGRRIALFSAIIIAAYNYLFIYFTPEAKIQEMMDELMGQYSTMLDANTLSAMEELLPYLPGIMFFSNLIYCWLYGSLLSAILSRMIPSQDPFATDNTPTES